MPTSPNISPASQKPLLIDAHVHLSLMSPGQLDAVLDRAREQGITQWIMAGYDAADWTRQEDILAQGTDVRLCFGLHPWRVIEMSPSEIDAQMAILERSLGRASACGETGIDRFRTKDLQVIARQEDIFLKHLELNCKPNLPLVLHIVQAHERSLEILRNYSYTGIVHGYSGSWETAKNYIALGYKISFGRGLFAKGFRHLKETAQHISLTDFVLESDSTAEEGEDPGAILWQVAQEMARIQNVPVEKICRANAENVKSVVGPTNVK